MVILFLKKLKNHTLRRKINERIRKNKKNEQYR